MILRPLFLAAVVAAAALVPMSEASAKNGKNAAFIGGAAVGVVGGALLGGAMSGAAAAPAPVYVEPAPPRYVAPQPVYVDRRWSPIERLRADCYDGSRRACIRFGMELEKNRRWANSRPDFYDMDRY